MKHRQEFSPLEIHLGHTVGGTTAHLTRSFHYTALSGIKYTCPSRMLTDGLSIPKFMWRIIGAPFASPYLAAGIIHDHLCIESHKAVAEIGLLEAERERLIADKLFREMLLFMGCSRIKAWTMYRGVRIGARSLRRSVSS